jgi:dUTP pyrophosphatase
MYTKNTMEITIQLLDESLNEYYHETKQHRTDSGYDLYAPETITVEPRQQITIDFRIRPQPEWTTGGFYLFPRSSISKTPLRMANSVGIIDYEYRGNIMAKVDNISDKPYTIQKGERLFQLCHPSLQPLAVRIAEVSTDTARGTGGFGSTGS